MQTGPKRGKSRKVSQGSQVERSMLQPASTVYNDDALQEQQDTLQGRSDLVSQGMTNEMSIAMLEKYDGQITPVEQTLQHPGTYSPSIVNIPIDSQGSRNYGDVMNNSFQGLDGPNTREDTMSDQTLYQDQHQKGGRDSVMKIIRNATLKSLNRPKVDLPSNLAIESKQYRDKRATSYV